MEVVVSCSLLFTRDSKSQFYIAWFIWFWSTLNKLAKFMSSSPWDSIFHLYDLNRTFSYTNITVTCPWSRRHNKCLHTGKEQVSVFFSLPILAFSGRILSSDVRHCRFAAVLHISGLSGSCGLCGPLSSVYVCGLVGSVVVCGLQVHSVWKGLQAQCWIIGSRAFLRTELMKILCLKNNVNFFPCLMDLTVCETEKFS